MLLRPLEPAFRVRGPVELHRSGAEQTRAIDPVDVSGVLWGMNYSDRITIESGKRSGKPCIRGLRITVSDVLEYLASGMTEEQILKEFPDLELERTFRPA